MSDPGKGLLWGRKMKLQMSLRFVQKMMMFALLLLCGLALAQTKPPAGQQTQNVKEYERLIYSVKGPDLYRAHCAVCHGSDGKGDGPLAPALKAKPADLTALAKNSGGNFPANRVGKFITGEEVSLSHGTREMPVWGPIFHQIEEDRDFGNVRVKNLVKYLETLQRK
jgi:mono/diheme cytochrome c family protein